MEKSTQFCEEISAELSKLKSLANIADKEKRLASLVEKSNSKDFWGNSSEAGKVMKELENLRKDIESTQSLISECEDFLSLVEMSREEEIKDLSEEADLLLKKIRQQNIRLQFTEPQDFSSAIATIHAGAGGTEACDWAEMLLRMYLRWAAEKNYNTKILDIQSGEEAGIKSVTFSVDGFCAYGYLKGEAGVHRLVRISPFDANKRRHTSFASVDIMVDIDEKSEVEIKPQDIKIDTYRASGHGGQHINKTDSAVRITHIPTGIVVSCQNERSQYKNKEMAMKVLRARLYALEADKKKEAGQRRYDEKGAIGWGYQIRSYVFMPYQLVKDLRTGYETGNISAVMDGNIDGFIEAYLKWRSG